MIKNEAKKVVFIMSPGHSGSTLLGHILGAHKQCLHIGEIWSLSKVNADCRCLFCGDNPCPIWGPVLSASFVHECITSCKDHLSLRRSIPRLMSRLSGTYRPPGAIYTRLFDAIPETDIIVDSSKNIPWANWNRRSDQYQTLYIVIVRDLRALLASKLRKRSDLTIQRAGRQVVEETQRVVRYGESLDKDKVFTVHYESIATDPDQMITQLTGFLGIPSDPDMKDFYRVEHHIAGGNFGPTLQTLAYLGRGAEHMMEDPTSSDYGSYKMSKYYKKTEGEGIKLDEKWKSELSDAMLAEFEPIGGALNRRLGYE